MTVVSTGFTATASADRYIQQLVKHWSHKFATSYADGRGEIPFSEDTRASFEAREDGIAIRLSSPSDESDDRMRGVIAAHVDRFAFREAPLAFVWERMP